jgi:hypothetical protein
MTDPAPGGDPAPLPPLERYRQATALYRFYLGAVVATNLIVFAITGALVAFVVSLDPRAEPVGLLGLLVPFLLNSGTGAVYARGLGEVGDLAAELRAAEDAVGHTFRVQAGVLRRLLAVSIAGYAANTLAILALIAWAIAG